MEKLLCAKESYHPRSDLLYVLFNCLEDILYNYLCDLLNEKPDSNNLYNCNFVSNLWKYFDRNRYLLNTTVKTSAFLSNA